MAIDSRFSKELFVREYARDSSSSALLETLESEIFAELFSVVAPKMEEIASRLRELGHELRYYEGPTPSVIALRDDKESEADEFDLLLALDSTVTLAFRNSSRHAALWHDLDDTE